jgi:SPP1 gp7 family putative phage head morphogenesis protein
LATLYRELEQEQRQDAADDAFIKHLKKLLGKVQTVTNPATVEQAAKSTQQANAREFKRVFGFPPKVTPQIRGFVQQNVGLVKSVQSDLLSDVAKVVTESFEKGSRVEVLKKRVQERFGVSESKASLIARDQVLKLNANITKQRMQDAGVARYKWSTARDERVRGNPGGKYPDTPGNHWRLEGKVFSWDDPPIVDEDTSRRAHPGEDYQCRCVAIPVFDELPQQQEQTPAPLPSFGPEFVPAVKPAPKPSFNVPPKPSFKAEVTLPAPPKPVPQPKLASSEAITRAVYDQKSRAFAEKVKANPDIAHAFELYTGSSYTEINSKLRSGGTSGIASAIERQLDKAVAAGLNAPGEVFRGLGLVAEELEAKFKVGQVTELHGLISTSIDRSVARGFAVDAAGTSKKRVILKIRQNSAVPVNDVSATPGEAELLMKHRSKFRVVSRREIVDNLTFEEIVLEEVL